MSWRNYYQAIRWQFTVVNLQVKKYARHSHLLDFDAKVDGINMLFKCVEIFLLIYYLKLISWKW